MKRKINLVGTSTLTVSLPSDWVKEKNLKKGDEIDLYQQGNDLIFSIDNIPSKKEIEIDISDYGKMTGRVLGALYKAGYDEIKLTFKEPESLDLIQKELLKGFIGLDIIHTAKKYCLLKSMADIKADELQTSMRRVFRLVLDNAQDTYDALNKKNYDELKVIASKDLNVNKFADFSRRLVNKHGYQKKQGYGAIYYILEELENIGDKYRELSLYLYENRFQPNKEVLKIYLEIKEFLNSFQDMFYSFKPEKYKNFGTQYKLLNKKIHNLLDSTNKRETIVLIKLESLLNAIFDLNGPLMTLQF